MPEVVPANFHLSAPLPRRLNFQAAVLAIVPQESWIYSICISDFYFHRGGQLGKRWAPKRQVVVRVQHF